MAVAQPEPYERLDALLDRVLLQQTDWVTSLQSIRMQADAAYDRGEIADYQWRALVSRSSKIQDMKNGD